MEDMEDGELNLDSGLGMLNVLNLLRQVGADDIRVERFELLTEDEILILHQNSRLIQKIVNRYPNEARNIGYQLIDETGNVIEENNPVVLEGFETASIQARLYGKAYLIIDNGDDENKRLSLNDEVLDYRIAFDLKLKGEFYTDHRKAKIHKSKVLIFVGTRTYTKGAKEDDSNYTNSVLQGVYRSFLKYENSINCIEHIVENLSYLKIGIKGLSNAVKTTEGQSRVFTRLQTVNSHRRIDRLLAHDTANETIEFINQTITGLSEAVGQIKELLVAEADYPYEILFGESTGKNALGSGTQNQLVQRFLWAQRTKTWAVNNWLGNYKKLFFQLFKEGFKVVLPFNLDLTPTEQAELELAAAIRTEKLISSSVITPDEARTGYRNSSFSLNIELSK